jgi:RNA polymerase sigma-70 factor (ECF subfamily)
VRHDDQASAGAPEARLTELEVALQAPGLDRRQLNALLDELAALARNGGPALDLLLSQIVIQELAEPPIRSLFFNEELVDDAVQETVIAVAVDLESFRGEAAFLTWLDRVARNTARQILRRRQRLSEPVSNDVPDRPDGRRRLSSIVADEQAMAQALATLSHEHHEVLLMREVDDLSYEEISRRLTIPLGTVRSRLKRARQQLTRELRDTMEPSI